jgi:hypothetical protein
MSADILTESYVDSQKAVAARLEEILDACRVKDFDRLAAYHLAGPKFTKFDDAEPLDRQDAEIGMRAEVEGFSVIDDFDGRLDDMKIDVFGPWPSPPGFSGRRSGSVTTSSRWPRERPSCSSTPAGTG